MKLPTRFGIKAGRKKGGHGVESQREGLQPLDPWQLLDRFLLFGTEVATYQTGDQTFNLQDAPNALSLAREAGPDLVRRVVETSRSGVAPRPAPAFYALALAASFGDPAARQHAFAALPLVCRTGAHLFDFVSDAERLRGWGRGMRSAIARWYTSADVEDLTDQSLRFQRSGGWSHRDLLRLSHPKPPTEAHRVLFKWIVDGELTGHNPRIEAVERLRGLASEQVSQAVCEEAAKLIRDSGLPRDCVPTRLLNLPEVWEALLNDMPLTQVAGNLANMTRCGLLRPGSSATRFVVAQLSNETLLRKARVDPILLLMARANYAGSGGHGVGEWLPVPEILKALETAFRLACQGVEPTGKRWLIALDVSGSMSARTVAGSRLSAAEAATAMALVAVTTERSANVLAFTDGLRPLELSPETSLHDALSRGKDVSFGGVDCALPVQHATRHRLEVDSFVVYTDAEIAFGKVHPAHALAEYRQRTGLAARLAVVGMAGERFSVADPADPGMLDVVGFDATVPQALRLFSGSVDRVGEAP